MKKSNLRLFYPQKMRRHLFCAMMACAACSIPASAFTQASTISVNKENVALHTVMQEVEAKSEYTFFYNDNQLKLDKKVSVNARNASIEQVLEQMFKDSGYTYKIVNKQILISKASVADVAARQQQQSRQVAGHVKDVMGEPIIGASVVEKGVATNGTITDFDGKFTLTISGNELQISYIGYLPQVVKVKPGVSSYDITLKEDTKTLDEVVVIGYGTQKKVNLTGSVASISTDEIKDRVQTNVLAAVQGTVPGVTIISRPGAAPSINFRGRGNLGTSAPLYVIDGAIADATVFSNLDPNTIESISFLKDAASASIYGSRAAYGVVLVTTKGGKAERMNVSYSGYVGVKTPTYLPEVLDSWDYATLLNEARYNVNPAGGKNQAYTDEEIGWFRDGSKPDYYPNTDWADLVLDKHVMTTQHSLNFSGGSEKVRFFSGVGYVWNDNFMPGMTDDRYNLNFNLQSDVTKWLTLKAGVKYIRNSSNTKNGTPWMANFVLVPSIMVAQHSNGEWGSIAGGKDATQNFMNSNPLRTLSFDNWNKSTTENTMYDLGFDLKPVKNLVISGQLDYKRYEYKSKGYSAEYPAIKHFETGKEIPGTSNSNPNSMTMQWLSASNLMTTLTAKYDLNLGKHAVNFLIGTSYEHYNYERFYSKRTDFVSDGLEDIEQGNNISKELPDGSGIRESKMLSYFGRINYSYKDRYLFEANLRADASSRFHKDNRWGWFPSFSAGWRINEEAFMKSVSWVNNLKLRASYGTLGNINNVGYYDYFELLTSGADYNWGGEPVKGVLEAQITNNELGWETVALADVGIDADLFDNKLSFTADYYIKNTKDILLGYNVPAETGIWTKPVMNLAKVRNTGFEFAVTYRDRIGDFSYSISANLATNNNKIKSLAGSDNMIPDSNTDLIHYILKEGESVGSYYGLKTDGLYTQEEIDAGHYYKYGRTPKAGDIKYVPQREGVEWKSSITDDDRTIIGKDVPDFTYGVNINLQWKNFELSAFGQGVSGTSVAFESEQVFAFMLNSNPRKYHLSRWSEENPNPHAACPRLYGGTYNDEYNKHFSDYQLFDADYFRIKTISLGYMVPQEVVTRWGLSSLKFFLTGENLFTFRADKDMKDFDPESSTGRGLGAYGTKSVAFGVNVSF